MNVEPLLSKWEVKRLEELSSAIQYGYTAKATTKRLGPKLLRITDIQNDAVDWDDVPFCEISAKEMEKYRLGKNDLLFARTGATVGKSYLISGSIPESVFASYLIRVRLLEEVYPKYVAYFFRSGDYWRQITENQAGIGQPNVNGTKLAQIKIPVAPLSQQGLIVAEIEKQFSRLDEAVATLKRVKANLKRYKAAVEGKLTEAWRKQHSNVEPASKLLKRILAERRVKWSCKGKYKELPIPDATILPRLPQTWTWSSVETICSDVVDCPQSTPKWQTSGRVCLRTTEFRPGRLDLSDVRYVSQATYEARIQRLTPRENDIVYSREGGILGLACMIPARLNPCLGQRMMLLRSHALFSPNLLMYWLNSPDLLARVRSLTGGSASPHLNVGEVKSFPVPVAPIAEQNAIAAEVERRLSVIEELEAAVEANLIRADRLRQSILSQAFSGRLLGQDTKHIQDILPTFSIAAEKQARYGKANRAGL